MARDEYGFPSSWGRGLRGGAASGTTPSPQPPPAGGERAGICCGELPPESIHLSFEPGPYRMAMSLVTVPQSEWMELDARYRDEMAERRRLLSERHDDVFAVLPEADAAGGEVLQRLVAYLTTRFPAWFSLEGDTLVNRLTDEAWNLAAPPCHPLELAGRLVQEDLCIVQSDGDTPRFTAAVLCFPSRWRLHEKLGRPLVAVHGPVPFYADRLAAPVNRFMAKVKPGHIASRLNWSVLDDPAMYQPTGKWRESANPAIAPDNAGDTLYLRVERQTLTRLPRTDAILFGIRVHSYRLAAAITKPSVAAQLAEAVRSLPERTMHYKSLKAFGPALLAWLDARAALPQVFAASAGAPS
jgi:dimethylamine monooxygenase subunit A